jgi:hypothetical protein
MFRWIVVLLLSCPAFATAQMVRGIVSDGTSGAPIKAANLSLYTMDGKRLVAGVSNDDGGFEIVLPKGRSVYLQAERIGYGTVKSEPLTGSTSELLQLNVRMSAVAVPLKAIEVVSRKTIEPRLQPFQDRASLYQRAGIGRIWTRADLEKRRIALISQFVTRIPQRREVALSWGKQICDGTVFYVDDVRMGVEDDDATAEDLDVLVSPDQVEGIEMYRDVDVPPDLLPNIRRFNHTPRDISAGKLNPPAEAPEYYCMMVMIWRKPYSELHAAPPLARVASWRRITTWLAVAGVFAVEQAIW